MRWITVNPKSGFPIAAKLELLRRAIAEHPHNPAHLAELGDVLARTRDFAAAADAYARALAIEPGGFSRWKTYARCELELGRPAAALDLCDRAEAHRISGLICCTRGSALAKLGQRDAARREFERALAFGDCGLVPLHKLLPPLAREEGGGALLEFCDTLPQQWRDTALVRAYRAIALSRLGRISEARHMVDLDRHIWRCEIAPPEGYADMAAFNSALAREILDGPEPDFVRSDGFELTSLAPDEGNPARQALLAIIRDAMERYLAQAPDRGLGEMLSPAPATAMLNHASLILRNDAANNEHVHGRALVSLVYHVVVPDAVANAEDERGSLVLGPCIEPTGGHEACWGKRFVKPVPGWLVLFPSHVFHDVVPTRTNAPRISVVADLWPLRD